MLSKIMADSLMCQVTKALEALDSIDPTKLLQGLRNGGIPQVSLDADSIAASYLILLYTPTEAIPRTHRADLLRRAVVADVYLGCNAARNHPGHDIIQTITIIREFIRRTLSQSASEEPVGILGLLRGR